MVASRGPLDDRLATAVGAMSQTAMVAVVTEILRIFRRILVSKGHTLCSTRIPST